MIRVFISHSSQDSQLAELVVNLLRFALNLRADQIRCTSVDGYRLPAGADSDEQLRTEVLQATSFIGILSPLSMSSAYVLFELGARWGAKKHLAPLLAPGMTAHALRGPITRLNALSCESSGQLHQLVQDVGTALALQPESPAVYQAKIDTIVYSAAPEPPAQEQLGTPTAPKEYSPGPGAATSANIEQDYGDAEGVIRRHCEKEWPADFNMRAYCMRQQREAAAQLQRGRPDDLPEDVFQAIRLLCAAEWPDDYAMRVYCERQQINGYGEVHEG
jgi:TIR domain